MEMIFFSPEFKLENFQTFLLKEGPGEDSLKTKPNGYSTLIKKSFNLSLELEATSILKNISWPELTSLG